MLARLYECAGRVVAFARFAAIEIDVHDRIRHFEGRRPLVPAMETNEMAEADAELAIVNMRQATGYIAI